MRKRVRAKKNGVRGPGGRKLNAGDTCWMHPSAARAAVARGDCEYDDDRIAGPSTTKVVGPSESKPAAPPSDGSMRLRALTIKAESMTKSQLWSDLKPTRDSHDLSWTASKEEMVEAWVAQGGAGN